MKTFAVMMVACLAVHAGERLTDYRTKLKNDGILRDIEVDGYNYCIVEKGRGDAMVLLHGLGGSIYDWRYLIDPLSKNHRVIAFDLLGAGESDKPVDGDYSVSAQARRVRGILDRLGIKKATLVGNSYGGGVALVFSQSWPERVDRLILFNSICYADRVPFYYSLSKIPYAEYIGLALPESVLARWVITGSYHNREKLSDGEIETYVEETHPKDRRIAVLLTIRALLNTDAREFERRLKSVRTPALLIWGKNDKTIPPELGDRLSKALPKSRLVKIDAAHVPNQECPDESLRLIDDFMKKS